MVKARTLARSSPNHDDRPELIAIAASEHHAVAIYQARGERHGNTLELDQLLLMRIEDGIVIEVTAYRRSQSAFGAAGAVARVVRSTCSARSLRESPRGR